MISCPGTPCAPRFVRVRVAPAGFTAAAPVEAPGGGPFYTLDACGLFHALYKVGVALKPDKSADDAGRFVADCLNPDRRERFDPDQVLWLLREGRRVGCHAAANFLMRESGYADPQPIEPEDERARLEREFIEAAKGVQAIAARLTRLKEAA